jgi:surface glycoprotein (TIGR04207 family)
MSNTREKLRAVFLTALMIGSVVGGTIALSGSVAAANADIDAGNSSVSPNSVEEGSTNTYEVTATLENVDTDDGTDDAYANFTFEGLDLSSSSVTDQSVESTLSTNSNTTNVGTDSGNNSGAAPFVNITWDDSGGMADDTLEISFNVSAAQVPNTDDVDVNLTADTNADGAENLTDVPVDTISVNPDSGITFSESTNDVTDENAEINLSLTDKDGAGIAEDSINVTAHNEQTGDNVTLVENGDVITGSALASANFTDGNNNVTEYVNLSVALQEGDYVINASATDINNNADSADKIGDSFEVDMAGDSLKVIADDTNPLASNQANVSIVAVDQNGNELIFNDSNVGTVADNIQLSFDDPANVTNKDRSVAGTTSTTAPVYNTSTDSYNVTFGVTYSEVGDLEITANDFSGNLSSGSATQTYTATISGVEVTADDGTLRADGSATENVTLQLVDQNGDPVPRAGVDVDFGVISGNFNEAGLDIVDEDTETNSDGEAVITYNATSAGEEVEVAGQTDNYQATASFNTTPGDISAADSTFELNGETDDVEKSDGVQVATEHNLTVTIEDAKGNGIAGESVTITANGSEITASPVTTNDSGVATATVTLPEQKGTTVLNVSAGSFNASATDDASISVTTVAANPSQIQFVDDVSTNLAPDSQDNDVTIEVYDQYGNLNESAKDTVNLTSSDASVLDFDGDNSASDDLSNGNVSFGVDANGTGSATLTATTMDADIENASLDFTVASPAGIEITFNHNVATSEGTAASTSTTATLTAQLVDEDGNALGISGENISFARQSGNAAELNQTLEQFTKQTGEDGAATIQVNGTATTGDTAFLALAENYSVQGTGTITTTGPAEAISVMPETQTLEQNTTTNVTVMFVDSEDRVVPRTTSVSLSADFGEFEDSSQTTAFNDDGQAVAQFVYEAPTDESGDTQITALGGGLIGTTTLTVEAPVEPGAVQIANANLDPSTVTANTTNDHTLTFDALNVTDDGSTDTFTVTFPSSATLESANSVSVVDSNGDTVSVTSSPELVDNGTAVTFAVSPDSDGEYRDLTVTVNATVTAPDVSSETTANITAEVSDSNNGEDSAMVGLTIQPDEEDTGPGPVVGDNDPADPDGDGQYEDVNGDGEVDVLDVQALFANQDSQAVQDNPTAFDFNGDGTVDVLDVQALFAQT